MARRSRTKSSGGSSKGRPMTPEAAARIQAAVDRHGGDSAFKARVMAAAAQNSGDSNPASASAQGPTPAKKGTK